MHEKVFQLELKKSFEYHFPNCLSIKIPDMIMTAQTRFIPRKPCDIVVLTPGNTTLVEAKMISRSMKRSGKVTGKSSWTVTKMEDGKLTSSWLTLTNQCESLMKAIALGHRGFFVVCLRGRFRETEGKTITLAYAIRPEIISQLITRADTETGVFHMGISEIVSAGCHRLEFKGGIWDVRPLMTEAASPDSAIFQRPITKQGGPIMGQAEHSGEEAIKQPAQADQAKIPESEKKPEEKKD